MGEFFRGWRRKVGCLTLVMACLTMGGWIRSLFRTDEVMIWEGDWIGYYVSSTPHRIHCQRMVQAGSSLAIMDYDLGVTIMFWQLVIPLTLLSACLTLWPGKRESRPPQSQDAS